MDKNKKKLLASVPVIILMLGGLVYLSNHHDCRTCGRSHADNDDVPPVSGRERPGIYSAGDGTWRILDDSAYVLRERKYVSNERERDSFLVRKVESGGILRIVEARGRWKLVEVMENGEVAARGWMDAHWTEKAERVGD